MSHFDDSADPDLGAACNRLAAFCETLPVGASIDDASGLTEPDLIRILRRLYATRLEVRVPVISMGRAIAHHEHATRPEVRVPVISMGRAIAHHEARTPIFPISTDPAELSNAEMLAEYRASAAGVGDPREDALAAEIERRGLRS